MNPFDWKTQDAKQRDEGRARMTRPPSSEGVLTEILSRLRRIEAKLHSMGNQMGLKMDGPRRPEEDARG